MGGGEEEREVEGRPITVGPPLIVIGGGRYLFFVPKNGARGRGEGGRFTVIANRRENTRSVKSDSLSEPREREKSVARQAASYIQTR